jgi:drug/metabolite transporter (DMT)-like permease
VGALADYFLKLASSKPTPWTSWQFVAGLLLYGSTAFGWLYVMKHMKLAVVGVVYTAAMLVLLALIGYFFFGEKLTLREWAGIGLALAAVALLSDMH